jgi:glucose/arabinose dehydrogenase
MLRIVSIATVMLASPVSANVLAERDEESKDQLLKGRAAFGGWQQDDQQVRGRPVGVTFAQDGSQFVTEDGSIFDDRPRLRAS